jgi:hypothetical protein
MATKKVSKRPTSKKDTSAESKVSIFVGCCSQALDIVFVNDATYTAEASGTAVKGPRSIRITHPSGMFNVLGLLESAVNKSTNPWQVFVVPGSQAGLLATTNAAPQKKVRKRK